MLGDYRDVKTCLIEALDECGFPPAFRRVIEMPLSQCGKALSGVADPRWPQLVLASCIASGGDVQIGARVAAAVEVFLAGADVLDDIQDGDPSSLIDSVGMPQALNAAAALLVLAHGILDRLDAHGVPPHRVPSFTRTLSESALRAAAGQHLDLIAEGNCGIGTVDAFEIARAKAGALGGMASRLGALVGTDDPHLLELYEALGTHVGTIAQINNDLRDSQFADLKTDVVRKKRTLPLVYATDRPNETPPPTGGDDAPRPIDAETRAFIDVVITTEYYRARTIIDALSDQGQNVAPLVELLG